MYHMNAYSYYIIKQHEMQTFVLLKTEKFIAFPLCKEWIFYKYSVTEKEFFKKAKKDFTND